MKYGRNYLSGFEGLAMDGKTLRIIAEFLTKLEELHLDGVFMETPLYSKLREKTEVVQNRYKTTKRGLQPKRSNIF